MSEYTKDGIKGINKNVHFLYEYPKIEIYQMNRKIISKVT